MYNNFNPYYQPRQYQQPMYQQNIEQSQQQYPAYRTNDIQGKIVDSIEVVKATNVSFDGVPNYFPLSDGSAVISKQLQQDGTTKIVIFKKVTEEEKISKYVTEEELENQIETIKKQVEELKSLVENNRGGVA